MDDESERCIVARQVIPERGDYYVLQFWRDEFNKFVLVRHRVIGWSVSVYDHPKSSLDPSFVVVPICVDEVDPGSDEFGDDKYAAAVLQPDGRVVRRGFAAWDNLAAFVVAYEKDHGVKVVW